ncbi:MAG TPA: type II secretion system F family protein [Candidatus Methylomirabilis sp.]|nr:type II secretion system F family protein [Candidatus Methylomirabilis sp.]
MPTFTYRAADRRGQTIEGVMEAPDARGVVERLQRDAYFPIKVAAQSERRSALGLSLPRLGGGRISRRDVLTFTHQLGTLVEAGLPLDRALVILEDLAPNPRLRTITTELLTSIRAGSSLAEAMAKHQPRPFSRLAVNMVRAGEKGGVLEATLKRLAELLEETQEFKETLVSALIYPILLTLAGAGAVVFLLTFVIPRFVDIFKDLGQSLPLPTQILLAISGTVQQYWWLFTAAILAIVVGVRMMLGSESGRMQWDRVALRLPLLGEVVLKTETARFARILGTLLKSGVPVLTALGVVRELSGNRVLSRAIDRVSDGVRRGAGIAGPLKESQAFPAMAVHIVRVGEETGRLEEMLLKLASDLESEVRRLVKRLMGLLEPSIILIMGLIVGFIVVALLMAIFSITEVQM